MHRIGKYLEYVQTRINSRSRDGFHTRYSIPEVFESSMQTWHQIPYVQEDLNLKITLNGGQSFRWKETSDGEWTGVLGNLVWRIRWAKDEPRQKSTQLEFKVWGSDNLQIEESEVTSRIYKYFRLGTDLQSLYQKWSECDENFKSKTSNNNFNGIRMLCQDKTENIFSFICSSNNNIARICGMVENMCNLFGDEICTVDGKTYHSFPQIERLAEDGVESKLRTVGFGYRAPFITGTAKKIIENGGVSWLEELSSLDYCNAKQKLMTLPGIGAKVADCICLMSLGHLHAVPVDTHVYQIAVTHYTPHLKGKKTLTTKIYDEITNHFQDLYGPLAGWAHSVLFCADLKSLQDKRKSEDTNDKMKRKKRH